MTYIIDHRTKKHKANYIAFCDGYFITIYSSYRQMQIDLLEFHSIDTTVHDASGKVVAYAEAGRVVFL